MPPRTANVDPGRQKERPLEFDKLVRDINSQVARDQVSNEVVSVVTFFLCLVMVLKVLRDVMQQSNLASAGAATSAAIPSADAFLADEDDKGDMKKDAV